MKKIESLTKAQKDKFPEYIKKWTEIGLSTLPADRPRAEKAIRLMYECAGLKAPKQIVWCGSPFSNALVKHILTSEKFWAELKKQLPKIRGKAEDFGASVRDSVGASVRDSVRDSVRASVRDSVGASVWDSVWASVGASVRDSVGASVGASVRASVWASVRDSVGASVGDSVYGQHDASWLGFYDYFLRECGLKKQTEKLEGLWELAESAGWAMPYENVCLVSERHCLIHRDSQGRLHNPNGPALEYPDGWRIYAINGVRTNGDWIEDRSKLTVQRIESEQNAEVRRIMVEQYGQAKYLADAEAKEIHRDDYGILFRKEQANDEAIVMVKVVNSTPELDGSLKDYFLRVPPTITTAREAVAWTFNKKSEDYAPAIET